MMELVTADLHLSGNPRDEYRWRVFDEIAKVIDAYPVRQLFILGDLTEAKDNHGAKLVNRLTDALCLLAGTVHVVVLRGNHDGFTPDNPFFRFIDSMHGMEWIQNPTTHDSDLFLPYTDDYKRDWSHLFTPKRRVPWKRIFCHQYFEGAKVESSYEVPSDRRVPLSVFPKQALVFAGDIHTPQNVYKAGHCVTYVGAPYTIDFGDDYKPRMLLLDGPSIARAIHMQMPMKRLVTCNAEGLTKWPAGVYGGDIVKIRVNLKANEYTKWFDITKKLREWAQDHDLIVHTIQPVIEKSEVEAAKAKPQAQRSDEQLLTEYGKSKGLNKSTLDAGRKLL